jgi:xanthine dehydrogenase iron-sulfur cluster and FAD-binding subunit A
LSATAPLTDIPAGLEGRFPALDQAIAVFATETIRNRATIGGNLATGSPAADTVPALLAADATVRLRCRPDRHRPARRDQLLTEFLLGPRRVDLRAGEWIESVLVPTPPEIGGMRKVAGRAAQAISLVSLAWQWEVDAELRLRRVQLAVGAAAPTAVRLPTVERILEGAPVAAGSAPAETIERAAAAVAVDIAPIDDLRASAAYRVRCAAGLLREILLDSPAGQRSTHRSPSEPRPTRSTH